MRYAFRLNHYAKMLNSLCFAWLSKFKSIIRGYLRYCSANSLAHLHSITGIVEMRSEHIVKHSTNLAIWLLDSLSCEIATVWRNAEVSAVNASLTQQEMDIIQILQYIILIGISHFLCCDFQWYKRRMAGIPAVLHTWLFCMCFDRRSHKLMAFLWHSTPSAPGISCVRKIFF